MPDQGDVYVAAASGLSIEVVAAEAVELNAAVVQGGSEAGWSQAAKNSLAMGLRNPLSRAAT